MGLLTAIVFGLGLFAEFLLLPPLLLAIEGLRQRFKRRIAKPAPVEPGALPGFPSPREHEPIALDATELQPEPVVSGADR
ncbi:MAG: hypothetical protein H6R26_2149 [Proteobacteria bacterium]|nr:hypothetical protein [Pseudomonadota bacterium]